MTHAPATRQTSGKSTPAPVPATLADVGKAELAPGLAPDLATGLSPAPQQTDLPVSPGDNPLSVTPKDVTPEDATARDLVARHLDSADPDEKQQERLDDAIDLSFPASDPPAVGGITRIDKPAPASRP